MHKKINKTYIRVRDVDEKPGTPPTSGQIYCGPPTRGGMFTRFHNRFMWHRPYVRETCMLHKHNNIHTHTHALA